MFVALYTEVLNDFKDSNILTLNVRYDMRQSTYIHMKRLHLTNHRSRPIIGPMETNYNYIYSLLVITCVLTKAILKSFDWALFAFIDIHIIQL